MPPSAPNRIPGSEDLDSVLGLYKRLKRCEWRSLYPAREQEERESGDNCPLVLHRRNGKQWVFIGYLDDLITNVIVAPDAGPWFLEMVQDLGQRYGLKAPVKMSQLAAPPS